MLPSQAYMSQVTFLKSENFKTLFQEETVELYSFIPEKIKKEGKETLWAEFPALVLLNPGTL